VDLRLRVPAGSGSQAVAQALAALPDVDIVEASDILD
jgi:hypothetical protein